MNRICIYSFRYLRLYKLSRTIAEKHKNKKKCMASILKEKKIVQMNQLSIKYTSILFLSFFSQRMVVTAKINIVILIYKNTIDQCKNDIKE